MSKKVLCIGGVTADVIVSPVTQLPQPGGMTPVSSISVHIGGCAANAAIDLAVLGVESALVCRVGNDALGEFVRGKAASQGVDVSGVSVDDVCPTSASVVCIAPSGERSFFHNPGATARLAPCHIPQTLLDAADFVFIAQALLLDSLDGAPAADVMRRARNAGKYTVLDTAWDISDVWYPKVRPVLPYVSLFMPSIDEAARLSGETDPDRMADVFFADGAQTVVIKMGSKGAYVCEKDGKRSLSPAFSGVKAVDSTGAGDSFCAGFICALAHGRSLNECARFANAVGAHCVTATGATAGIRPMAEIDAFIAAHGQIT